MGGRAVPDASSREAPTAEVFDEALIGPEVVETVDEAPEVVDEAPEVVEAVDEAPGADDEADEAPEAETADEPEDVIAAETPADTPEAPSTPNQEGAVD